MNAEGARIKSRVEFFLMPLLKSHGLTYGVEKPAGIVPLLWSVRYHGDPEKTAHELAVQIVKHREGSDTFSSIEVKDRAAIAVVGSGPHRPKNRRPQAFIVRILGWKGEGK